MSANEQTRYKRRRCAYCGQKLCIIWVHGHGQCAHCGINIAECCQGEQCSSPGEQKIR